LFSIELGAGSQVTGQAHQENVDKQTRLEDLLHRASEADGDSRWRPGSRAFVLYGAGNLGRSVAQRLRASGVTPVAFADDTVSKQGIVLDGLEVLSPEAVIQRFGKDVSFFVTILNPALRFVDARERLRQRIDNQVFSVFDLARTFPDFLFPLFQYDRPEKILGNAQQIRRAFSILTDEKSRREFLAHLEFRLMAKYELLPDKSRPAYFPKDLIGPFAGDSTFVDCGAYDGDTIRQFLLHQGGRFGAIVAFEPDRHNYAKLAAYVGSLGADIESRIDLHHGAVGDHSGEAPFNQTGDMSAAVSPNATGKVALFALDDVVRPNGSAIYVKFDIEGFELQALKGARRLLQEQCPTLAVSAYHRPEDLWEIPLYLHDLDVGYCVALRTEGDDGMDVVCYALPAASNPATPA
jgi:FkbM family methyltransferase